MKRSASGPTRLIIWTGAWIALAANLPLWRALYELNLLDSIGGWGLAFALALMIGGALTALLALFTWRGTLKPVLTLLLLAAAAGAYFMWTYRVTIDSTMIVNVLQTNAAEAADLLSVELAAFMLVLGLLPAVLIWRAPIVYGRWPQRLLRNALLLAAGLAVTLAAGLASFQPLAAAMRNHKALRYMVNPLNSLYGLGLLAAAPLRIDRSRLQPIGLDAQAAPGGVRPPLLLLVVGETARAANFGLNGYARDTTPELSRERVVSFRNAWSCGTSTATSLPCMFSHLGRESFGARRHEYENLLDILQRAGLAVLWLDNQSGCKGLCDRVPHATVCTDGACFDEALLDGLDARIAALPAERRARGVVLILHQMGSHGPAYWLRSPPALKRFLPECESNELQRCPREQVVNAYDNSILYTDHLLGRAIGWLRGQRDYDNALVYVSDHGESLGEANVYLHGLPYALAPDEQKRVPWITWLSPGFEQRAGLSLECLRGRAEQPVSHDHYFHSVLGLLGVSATEYRRALDAYAPCTTAGAATAGG
jgi:lipid A ethanolaminephosphotransferase